MVKSQKFYLRFSATFTFSAKFLYGSYASIAPCPSMCVSVISLPFGHLFSDLGSSSVFKYTFLTLIIESSWLRSVYAKFTRRFFLLALVASQYCVHATHCNRFFAGGQVISACLLRFISRKFGLLHRHSFFSAVYPLSLCCCTLSLLAGRLLLSLRRRSG